MSFKIIKIDTDNILKLNDDINNKKIYISDNKKLIINEINNKIELTKTINIYLNNNSQLTYNLSNIVNKNMKFIINIYHNKPNSISNVITRSLILNNETLDIEINSYVKNGSKKSVVNQDSKIINLKNSKSIVKPNMYIDESDVDARHGLSIGYFNKQNIFYLQSRGLSKVQTLKLLEKGFLFSHMEE